MTTYEPTEYTGKLMLGLARLLTDNGFGVYRDTGIYADGEQGIYLDYAPAFPQNTTPQESITITPYLPQQGILAIEHTSIQLRYQWVNKNPLWVRDQLDKVRRLFPREGVFECGGLTFDRVYQRAATTWGEEGRPGVLTSTQNIAFRGNRYE